MLKVTKVLPMIIEPEDSLDELAIYLTEHIDEYYTFKENHKVASFYIGRRGRTFRIKVEADRMKPWLSPPALSLIGKQVVDENDSFRWVVHFEELTYSLNLKPTFIVHGFMPTWSETFPIKQIKKFVYTMSLEDEDCYV